MLMVAALCVTNVLGKLEKMIVTSEGHKTHFRWRLMVRLEVMKKEEMFCEHSGPGFPKHYFYSTNHALYLIFWTVGMITDWTDATVLIC